jgi:hypothetical protein
VVQEIETLLGRQVVGHLDLEALELAVRQRALQMAGAAVEQRPNADTSDERGSRTCCGCPNIPLPPPAWSPGRPTGHTEGNSSGYRRRARIPAMMGQNSLNQQILEISLIILLLSPARWYRENRAQSAMI